MTVETRSDKTKIYKIMSTDSSVSTFISNLTKQELWDHCIDKRFDLDKEEKEILSTKGIRKMGQFYRYITNPE